MTAHVVLRDGRHNFTFWSESFRHALPWLAGRLAGEADPPVAPGGTTQAAASPTPPAQ